MNVEPMLVNELVSQASGWLNLLAYENVYPMFVTLLVSQASGWLNLLALRTCTPSSSPGSCPSRASVEALVEHVREAGDL